MTDPSQHPSLDDEHNTPTFASESGTALAMSVANSVSRFGTTDPSTPPPPMVLSIGTYVRHKKGVIQPSLGLSIAERAEEMRKHLGFDHTIRTHRLSPASLVMTCRDFYAYLEYARTVEHACYPSTFQSWIKDLSLGKKAPEGSGITRDYAATTINRMAAAVRTLMKEAGRQGYLHPQVAKAFQEDVEMVKEEAHKHYQRPNNRVEIKSDAMLEMIELTEGDRRLALRNRALLLTLASTGLRVDSFRRLRLDQIVRREKQDWAFRVMGKNEKKTRDVPMSDDAYAAIQTWVAARPVRSPYIFTRFDGGNSEHGNGRLSDQPLSSVSIWRIVKRYGAAVGLLDAQTQESIIKPHDFRRFVGTRVAKKHGPKQAQLQLGHKHIATTLDNYVLEEPDAGVVNDLF